MKTATLLKEAVKSAVPPGSRLGRFLRTLYHFSLHIDSSSPKAAPSEIRRALESFSARKKDVFFIQIGSCDGVTGDPLFDLVIGHRWRGILVEPVDYVFERLARNYRGVDGVTLENLAISHERGDRPFWHLRKVERNALPPLPHWYDQIGSFDREHLLKHKEHIPDIEERIVERKIPCITFQDLLDKHGVRRLDLLHIDSEGHDYEIIRQIDFQRLRPEVILYEHQHLSPADRAACESSLKREGYEFLHEGLDTLARLIDRDRGAAGST